MVGGMLRETVERGERKEEKRKYSGERIGQKNG
jgi:hypothetical protein